MTTKRYLHLCLVVWALSVLFVQTESVAFAKSGKLYLWRANLISLGKTQVEVTHNHENTTIPVAERLQVIGPMRPGSDVNLVYAEIAKEKRLAVLIQFQPESKAVQAPSIQKEDEAALVPEKLAKRILEQVTPLRPALMESPPAAPNRDVTKPLVANGRVNGFTVVSPFEKVLSLAPSPPGPITNFTVDLLTSVQGELVPNATVKISYVSLDSKRIASEVEVAREVTPELKKQIEAESGKVASNSSPENEAVPTSGRAAQTSSTTASAAQTSAASSAVSAASNARRRAAKIAQEPASHKQSVTGCLERGDEPGEFSITGEDGKTWKLHSKTVKLEEHVGRKVTVTGSAPREWAAKKDAGAAKMAKTSDDWEYADLYVTSVGMISESCK
jgi:hypothetical protein